MEHLKTGLAIGMVFLFTTSFGQVTGLEPENTGVNGKTTHTYLDLMVQGVSTNIHYGASNSAVADFKKSANGIQAGASFQAGITHGFSLVSELYYIRKGGKLKADNPLTGGASTLRINTLELPVLARFHFGKCYLNAGPSLAYNLSGSRKTEDQSVKLSFSNSNEGFKRLDAGIQMGGGFEFPLREKRIALDIRYVYGLTNISRSEEIYNRALIISVHFSKAWKKNPLGRG